MDADKLLPPLPVPRHAFTERGLNNVFTVVSFTADQMRQYALAAIAAAGGGGWREIESAPTNGADVLLYQRSKLTMSKFVGRYEGRRWLSIPGAYVCYPTHWQPLPTLPEVKK